MFKEIICGIYKITSPSGKIYIGESENIQKNWNKKSPVMGLYFCLLRAEYIIALSTSLL